jgi:WD40 repeat protein
MIQALDLTLDGSLLITASQDSTVKVWDVASRQLLRTFTQHKGNYEKILLFIQLLNKIIGSVNNVQCLLRPEGVGNTMSGRGQTGRSLGSIHSNQNTNSKLTTPPVCAFKRIQHPPHMTVQASRTNATEDVSGMVLMYLADHHLAS